MAKPRVKAFFDRRTSSLQYVVSDPDSRHCAIIDAVLDFDERSGATGTTSADKILAYVEDNRMTVQWILDTHPHADHLSASAYIKEKTGALMATGSYVTRVQQLWKSIYNLPDFKADGSQWDRLFDAEDTFQVGTINGTVLYSPGHTMASVSFLIGDAAFIHDTLFMPDSGTARADFPGGDPAQLYQSIQHILALPSDTRLYVGHDYQPNGREVRWQSTVGEQKATNSHVSKGRTEAEFIALRLERDRTLPMPKLMLFALQVNMNGGRLPSPEPNGTQYLKIPLNVLEAPWWERKRDSS